MLVGLWKVRVRRNMAWKDSRTKWHAEYDQKIDNEKCRRKKGACSPAKWELFLRS